MAYGSTRYAGGRYSGGANKGAGVGIVTVVSEQPGVQLNIGAGMAAVTVVSEGPPPAVNMEAPAAASANVVAFGPGLEIDAGGLTAIVAPVAEQASQVIAIPPPAIVTVIGENTLQGVVSPSMSSVSVIALPPAVPEIDTTGAGAAVVTPVAEQPTSQLIAIPSVAIVNAVAEAPNQGAIPPPANVGVTATGPGASLSGSNTAVVSAVAVQPTGQLSITTGMATVALVASAPGVTLTSIPIASVSVSAAQAAVTLSLAVPTPTVTVTTGTVVSLSPIFGTIPTVNVVANTPTIIFQQGARGFVGAIDLAIGTTGALDAFRNSTGAADKAYESTGTADTPRNTVSTADIGIDTVGVGDLL